MHVALFGGSFNPPHVGHLLAAAYVRAVAPVDAVWLMPAFQHRFGKPLAPFEDRLALCSRLVADLRGVEVTSVEADVAADGRTLLTVEHLQRLHPGHRFSLVIGSDLLTELPRWYRHEELLQKVGLVVLGRAGFDASGAIFPGSYFTGVKLPEVSSTEVRARLADGRDVSALVPRGVLEEIRSRGLYPP